MRASKMIVSLLLMLGATTVAQGNLPKQQSEGRSPRALVLTPCDIPGVDGKARCGTYEVFENRKTKRGRKIPLKIIVLPATATKSKTAKATDGERAPDPFVYIPGGPGSSATEDAPAIAQVFAKIRERRDLVFMDQRGTGGSNPLNCNFFTQSDPQSFLGYFYPLDEVTKCREELELKADLRLYTTPIAMDDLDEVRKALGYQSLNLFGASYGTRAALVYLKRHPKSVRTLTLMGVAPIDQYVPASFPQSTERALQGIIAECLEDDACKKAFPNLRAETNAVLERLLQGPVETDINFQGNGRQEVRRIKLSRNLAAEAIRYMLYQPIGAGRVPLFLHLSAQGDFSPLAEAALNYRRQIVASGSTGLYLSITCAEDLPWIKPGEGERLAANTFLGDYRLKQQQEACALWPRASLPVNYFQPTKASAPVLILTGEWDPATPPANGDAIARHLPNSKHVVVPDGAHGFFGLDGLECVRRINVDFLNRGAVNGLDTSCLKNVRRKGFALAK